VAYFSSVVLLALAASQPASGKATGTTTYFDSVVFITMFLLAGVHYGLQWRSVRSLKLSAGRYLEDHSKSHTTDAVTALSKLRPAEALLVIPRSHDPRTKHSKPTDDVEKGHLGSDNVELANESGLAVETVNVDLLEIGDVVRVSQGSTPPADGIIIPGQHTAFDESSMTGESRLIQKQGGDQVFLGTINKLKAVDVKITAIGGGTM
jgi:P-type Cu+ transporter